MTRRERFCGLTLSGPIPDETTILHFRHLLERHQLGGAVLETINTQLAGQGLRLQAGTIVDARHRLRPRLDQEPGPRARPGDATDQEGQRVAPRDEAAHRRRQLRPESPLAQRERARASLRAKVEHPFRCIKQRFGYRGLAKNHQRLPPLTGHRQPADRRAATDLNQPLGQFLTPAPVPDLFGDPFPGRASKPPN